MAAAMSFREKVLYHQIHPAKIATDLSAGALCLILLWQHHLTSGLLVALLPPAAASLLLIAGADLRPYKRSRAGWYLRRYMTPLAQSLRLAGFALAMVGAWQNRSWMIVVGVLVVAACWFYGLLPFSGS